MEIVYTPKGYRGFKSLLLRQKEPHPSGWGFLFGGSTKKEFEQSNASVRRTLAECRLVGIHTLVYQIPPSPPPGYIPFCGDLKRPYCCYIESISGANFKVFFVTGSCVSPAQGRQSQWAWTGNRSCRFPGRCGDPHQRRSPSWQEWGYLPRQGFPVRGCGGWRCSRP